MLQTLIFIQNSTKEFRFMKLVENLSNFYLSNITRIFFRLQIYSTNCWDSNMVPEVHETIESKDVTSFSGKKVV